MLKFFNRLLQVEKEKRTIYDVLTWWETRRILYNFIIYLLLHLRWVIIDLMADAPSLVDTESANALFIVIICNVSYTLGWITELFNWNKSNYAPKLFKIGVGLTLLFVIIPAVK